MEVGRRNGQGECPPVLRVCPPPLEKTPEALSVGYFLGLCPAAQLVVAQRCIAVCRHGHASPHFPPLQTPEEATQTQTLHFATFPAPCSPAPGSLLPALCSYVELLPNDCCEMIYIGIDIGFVSTAVVVDAMQIH